MRSLTLLATAVALILSGAAEAQTSPPFYISRDYRFAIIFPTEPVATDMTYATGSGASVPARQFTVDQNGNRHVITIADFSSGATVDIGVVDRAAAELRRRGEVRFQADEEYDPGLPGRQFNIIEPNGRQLRASVYMWDHRLYITEAEGDPGAISLLQFEQSVTLLDADGKEINLDAALFEGGGRGP
jgi:hypothetical protein